jgi:hypothetical protein
MIKLAVPVLNVPNSAAAQEFYCGERGFRHARELSQGCRRHCVGLRSQVGNFGCGTVV